MKFKFNLKLTAFLVSLFVGLVLVILGSFNKYCLSFGFLILGVSLECFVWYQNEKTSNAIIETKQQIDEFEQYFDEQDEDCEISDEEQVFVLQQLYQREKKLVKQKRSVNITFRICSVLIIFLGVFGMF